MSQSPNYSNLYATHPKQRGYEDLYDLVAYDQCPYISSTMCRLWREGWLEAAKEIIGYG